MPKFEISTDICLGYHCDGCGEFIDAEGTVELTDLQVSQLIDLIKENNGETDIAELKLKEKYPEIYKNLDRAFHEMVKEAELQYWVLELYERGDLEEPEGFMDGFEEEGFIEPDFEEDEDNEEIEDERRICFEEWLDEYVGYLNNNEKVKFILKHYGEDIIDTDEIGNDYNITIPDAIIQLASKG